MGNLTEYGNHGTVMLACGKLTITADRHHAKCSVVFRRACM